MKRAFSLKVCIAALLAALLAALSGCAWNPLSKEKAPVREPFIPDAAEIRLEVAQGYEAPPIMRAAALLPPALRSGPHHIVGETVYNDGFWYHFTIFSDFGEFYAGSQDMLEIRVEELEVLSRLHEISSQEVALESGQEAGKNLLLAPVHGVKRLVTTLSDPQGTWETMKEVPGGIKRFFSYVADEVESYASSGDANGAGDIDGEDKEAESADRSEELKRATEAAVNYGLRRYGFNLSAREREWHERLGSDPYTDNQEIQARIRQFASIETGINTASRFVPGLGSLAYVGTVNRMISWSERIAMFEDPRQIAGKNITALREMGVREELITDFYKNPFWSPTFQSLYVRALQGLNAVKNRAVMIEMASKAGHREDVLSFIRAAEYLGAVHAGERGLEMIISKGGLPAAVSAEGLLIVPLAVDYLVWTREVAAIFRGFRKRAVSQHAVRRVELRVKGGLSARCRKELHAHGVEVLERVPGLQ